MAAREPKTIRIRCASWDQVEAFYAEKLKGNVLVVKMPFRPMLSDPVTVALSLPDGLVFAIDGTVVKIGADDGGRVPVAVKLFGLTTEVRGQLRRLVAQGRGGSAAPVGGAPVSGSPASGSAASGSARAVGTRPPLARTGEPRRLVETVPPPAEPSFRDVVEEEREIFEDLAATRERLYALPVYDVLGVPADADSERAYAAYLGLALKLHPDRFRRYRSSALRLYAADAFLHLRRALERFEGVVPASVDGAGWLVALGDGSEPPIAAAADADAGDGVVADAMQASGSAPYSELSITRGGGGSPSYEEDVSFTTSVRMRALTAEELFDEEPTPSGPTPGPAELAARVKEVAAAPPAAAPPPSAPPEEPPERALEASARAALAEGRFRDACEDFAAFLRLEPRNRPVRALYHVASGMDLRGKGEGVKARLQFETALAHDRECEEARRALAPDAKKGGGGLLKRLFDSGEK